MRKLVSALAIAAGLSLLAAPALAQPYPPTTPSGNTPPTERLTVSDTTVAPGESFTVSGDGAEPGATVTFTLRRSSSALGADRSLAAGPGLARLVAAVRPQAQSSVPLGSTTANGAGEFSATLTIPSSTDPGLYTLTATSGGDVLAVVTIRVAAASGGIGDLPFTGGNVLPGLAIGATLIVVGGLLLLSLKRRRSTA
jgi:LPXTG cell wall anchor motif